MTCSLYSLALSGAGEESNQIFERPWALVIVFGKAETKDLYADLSGPVIGIVLEEMHMTTLSVYSIKLVSEEHGYNFTFRITCIGACGTIGDKSMRWKSIGVKIGLGSEPGAARERRLRSALLGPGHVRWQQAGGVAADCRPSRDPERPA